MNKKEFYNSVILGIPAKEILDEEQIKKSVICECKIMDKVDVYEWCAENEFKNKQLKEQLQRRDEVIKEAIKQIIYMQENEPSNSNEYDYYCRKLLFILDILNRYKNKESK